MKNPGTAKPRLLLLTGPAAGDVAAVLSDEHREDADCNWAAAFEVRDYWEAPRQVLVAVTFDTHPVHPTDAAAIEHGIRSLPGGEAWLVGLVLPEPMRTSSPWYDHDYVQWAERIHYCATANLPARLAILAPEPPPLLVERVRAWGGGVWECADDPDTDQGVCYIGRVAGSPAPAPACPASMTCAGRADTWPEAVRAALGEA